VGVGASGCSRTTISKVKDAFAEAATPQCDGGRFQLQINVPGRTVRGSCERHCRERQSLAVRVGFGIGFDFPPRPSASAFDFVSSASPSVPLLRTAALKASRGLWCEGACFFCKVCKEFAVKQVKLARQAAASAALAVVPAGGERPEELPLTVCALAHIHEEASLRLRSASAVDAGAPSRARSSKVMQHCAMVHFVGQAPLRWLEELHPLADKTAPTLATSLRKVLEPVSDAVGSVLARRQAGQKPWMVHILIGDGASTNDAAAKVLLSWAEKSPLHPDLRYLLIVVKCSSHQANLAVAAAVSGRAALASALVAAPLAKLAGPSMKVVVSATPFAGGRVCALPSRACTST